MYRQATHKSCVNCGKQGHITHSCNQPIISHGLILLDLETDPSAPRLLMICRKDSFGFIDLVRGKYSPSSVGQVQSMCDSMTMAEREFVLTHTFEEIWEKLWGASANRTGKSAELAAANKFDLLRRGIKTKNGTTTATLDEMLAESTTTWEDAEWEFPKGRRNTGERDFECAVREFHEETGLLAEDVGLVTNLQPMVVTFSANKKQYTYKYFLAIASGAMTHDLRHFQVEEVSKLEWKTFDECMASLRDHEEKRELVLRVQKAIQAYQFIYVPVY